jgi:hypothetical protein
MNSKLPVSQKNPKAYVDSDTTPEANYIIGTDFFEIILANEKSAINLCTEQKDSSLEYQLRKTKLEGLQTITVEHQ